MSRFSMPRAERSHSTITLSIPSVVALILVPLLVAAGLIGTTWKMTDRLGQVKAAVVNEDAGVKLNGQQAPLGRQLSGGLIKSDTQTTDGRNISWELTDSSKASDGLKDGTYAAVVTIPKSFSKDATSYSANKADAANSARIDVKTSDSAPVTDTTIARMTAQAAEREMNKTLNSQYLDNIYIGFNKSANSMVSLAKGAKQLDTGAAGLKSGINQSTNGAYQLNNGMKQLDKGGQTLASNGSQLTTGVKQLSTGINALDTNGQKLAAGGDQLNAQLKKQTSASGDTSQLDQLNQGMSGLKTGTAGLATGLSTYQKKMQSYGNGTASMPDQVEAGAKQKFLAQCQAKTSDELKTQQKSLSALKSGSQPDASTPSTPIDKSTVCNQLWTYVWNGLSGPDGQEIIPGMKTSVEGGFQAGTTAAAERLDQKDPNSGVSIMGLANQMSSVSAKLQPGVSTLITQLKSLPAQMKQLQQGIAQYTSGVSQYTAGVHKLNQQMPTLSSGISQYVSGVGTFADGVHQSAQGVDKFYDGQVQLSQGATKYAKGVNTFSTELQKGSKQVPTYSAADREKLSDVVSTPVNADTNPMGTSAWVVSLIVILGLWLGALAMWLVARTVPSRVLTSSKSSLKLLWSSMSTGALVTGISALGLTIIASLATDLSAGRTLALFGMLLLVGAMCLAVNHALAAWLHAAGRFISLLFFIVAAAVGLVSAVPKPISTVHSISPLKPAMEGVTAILTGNAPSFGSFVTIILWLVIGGVASLLAVNRARRTSAAKVVGQLA